MIDVSLLPESLSEIMKINIFPFYKMKKTHFDLF